MMTEILGTAATVLTGIGVLDLVKYYATGRKKDTQDMFKEQVEFMQGEIVEKQKDLRRLNEELLEAKESICQLRVELAATRCRDAFCPWRIPPNASTPGMPDKERAEWMRDRRSPCDACPDKQTQKT